LKRALCGFVDSHSMPLSWEPKIGFKGGGGVGKRGEPKGGVKKEWSRVDIIQPTNSIRLSCLAFAVFKPPFYPPFLPQTTTKCGVARWQPYIADGRVESCRVD